MCTYFVLHHVWVLTALSWLPLILQRKNHMTTEQKSPVNEFVSIHALVYMTELYTPLNSNKRSSTIPQAYSLLSSTECTSLYLSSRYSYVTHDMLHVCMWQWHTFPLFPCMNTSISTFVQWNDHFKSVRSDFPSNIFKNLVTGETASLAFKANRLFIKLLLLHPSSRSRSHHMNLMTTYIIATCMALC